MNPSILNICSIFAVVDHCYYYYYDHDQHRRSPFPAYHDYHCRPALFALLESRGDRFREPARGGIVIDCPEVWSAPDAVIFCWDIDCGGKNKMHYYANARLAGTAADVNRVSAKSVAPFCRLNCRHLRLSMIPIWHPQLRDRGRKEVVKTLSSRCVRENHQEEVQKSKIRRHYSFHCHRLI